MRRSNRIAVFRDLSISAGFRFLPFYLERETLKMMRKRNNAHGFATTMNGSSAGVGGGGGESGPADWEMRPGGMLVQRRTLDSDRNSVPAPTIRVRVKYGSTYHEVNISSQATFGNSFSVFFLFLIIFCLKFLALHSLSLDFYVFVTVNYFFTSGCRGIEENAVRANWVASPRSEIIL